MGWTSYGVDVKYKGNKKYIDRKEECDRLFNQDMIGKVGKYEVLRSTVVGAVYYAAVKKTKFATDVEPEKSEVFGVVVLTRTNINETYNFSYKDMDETCGPCYYDCPNVILDLLSPTENEYANEWRQKCREKTKLKSLPTNLSKLPVGAKIKFLAPFDTQTYKKGEEIILWKEKKMPKGTYWIDGKHAYPAKFIGNEYEIIEEE